MQKTNSGVPDYLEGVGINLTERGKELLTNAASDLGIEAEQLKHKSELEKRDSEIAALRRRVADLEDFLRGAAIQFSAVAGR